MWSNILLKRWLIDIKVRKVYRILLEKCIKMNKRDWNRYRNKNKYKKNTLRQIEKVNSKYEEKVKKLEDNIVREYMSLVVTMCIQQLKRDNINLMTVSDKMKIELDDFINLLRHSTKHDIIDKKNRKRSFIKGINKIYLLYNSYYPKKSICNDLPIKQVLEIMSNEFKKIGSNNNSLKLKDVKRVLNINKVKTLNVLIVSAFVYICKLYYIELYDYERSKLRWDLYRDLYMLKSHNLKNKAYRNKLYDNLKSVCVSDNINDLKVTFRLGEHVNDVIEPTLYNTLINKLNPIIWIGSYSSIFVKYYISRSLCGNGDYKVNNVIDLLSMNYRIDVTQFWMNRDGFMRRVNYKGMERWYIKYHLNMNDILQNVSSVDRKYIWGVNTDLTNLIVLYNNWPSTNFYIETEYKTSYLNYMF